MPLTSTPPLSSYQNYQALKRCTFGLDFLLFCVIALWDNTILFLIKNEQSLHQPMFYFLAMLMGLSTLSTIPKMLGIFWLNLRKSALGVVSPRCSSFIYSLLWDCGAVALWRYVAICNPFGIVDSPTSFQTIGFILIVVLIINFILVIPLVFLILRLPFCGHHIIPTLTVSTWESLRLACACINVNIIFGLILISMVFVDVLLIVIS